MESTPDEVVMNSAKMTTKDLECCLNLVDKVVAGFEKINSNFEGSSMGKMLSNRVACYREIIHERKSLSMWHISLLF